MIDLLTDVFYGRYNCKLCLGIIFLKINGKIIVVAFEPLLKGMVCKCGSKMTLKLPSSVVGLYYLGFTQKEKIYVNSKLFKVLMALRGYSNLETHIPEFTCCLGVRLRVFQLTISTNFLSFYAAEMAWGHGCVGHFVFIL